MADVPMPRLSDSMEEGTILKWLKQDGDDVKRGEELVEIETDKANMTYESDQDGVLTIAAQEGDTLPVGAPIARIGEGSEPAATASSSGEASAEAGGDTPEPATAAGRSGATTATAPASAPEPEPAPAPSADGGSSANGHAADGGERILASPVARRMARELGVDLAAVRGTGPGGRIVKADVEAAGRGEPVEAAPAQEEAPAAQPAAAPSAPAPTPAPAAAAPATSAAKGEVTHQELTRLQQTVARRMAESKATAPDFVLDVEVDMEAAVALRAQLKEAAGERPVPSYNDMVVKAAALVLREYPRANGAYRDGRFELYSRVNVGVAVAGQDALVVPTVFDADIKSLSQIGFESRRLAERVRSQEITPPELSGGTFAVSNLGMYGIDHFTAVINPPQAAILAVGKLAQRAVVRDGEIVARHTMTMTLSCDHRILYGADAAVFLDRIRTLLEQPLELAF